MGKHSLANIYNFLKKTCFSVLISVCYQVISAQQLPKVNNKKSSIVDPLVKVQIFGVPADVETKETSVVDNNGNFLGSVYSVKFCTLLDLIF